MNGEEQQFGVKDTSGAFVFLGEMADSKDPKHVIIFLISSALILVILCS